VTTAPRPARSKARALLGQVVAWDLDTCAVRLPDHALADTDWAQLRDLSRTQRAEAPLARAIAAGALVVTTSQQDQAYEAHRAAMSLTLLLERDLLALHRRFVAAGVDAIVAKGVATSHLDEPDPAARGFGDVDLLVPASSLADAVAVVEDAGGVRRHAEPRPGFDVRFSKGVSFRFARNCEIDLHRTLAPGPFGLRVDLDELFAAREPFAIGGTELHALDRGSRFLHACYHAALGDAYPRLTTLRDIVRTAPGTDVECRVVLGRAQRWGSTAVVATAVDHAVAALGWRPPEPLATWARVAPRPRDQRRWLAAYAGEGRLAALQAIQGLVAVDGLADRLAYARAIALPAPEAQRTPTRDRARRGVRALARMTRP
jgi:hypothetical protein